MVEALTGMGIPQSDIVAMILSPTSGEPISEVTLRKLFKTEIRTGTVKVKAKIAQNLLKQSETVPSVAIFLGKTRLGLKERSVVEHVPPVSEMEERDIDARIRQLEDRAAKRAAEKRKPGADEDNVVRITDAKRNRSTR